MSTTTTPYPDNFSELKAKVRQAGLLDRVPVRGSIEMIDQSLRIRYRTDKYKGKYFILCGKIQTICIKTGI